MRKSLKKIYGFFIRFFYFLFLKKLLFWRCTGKTRGNDKIAVFLIDSLVFGGVQKVVLDIIRVLIEKNYIPLVFATKRSSNQWHDRFGRVAKVIDIRSQLVTDELIVDFLEYFLSRISPGYVIINNCILAYENLIRLSKLGISFIDVLHGEGIEKNEGDFARFLIKTESHFSRRIFVSEYLLRYTEKYFVVNKKKYFVIHNSVECSERVKNRPDGYFTVAFIGRLSPEKNPHCIIDIAKKVHYYHPELKVKFVITGDGPERESLEIIIRDQGLLESIELLGYVDDIDRIYNNSDILLITSIIECLPLVALEAIARKVPVISTNVGGLGEIVVDGKNGFLIERDDRFAENAAKKICFLAENPGIVDAMGEEGARIAMDLFSFRLFADAYSIVLGLQSPYEGTL